MLWVGSKLHWKQCSCAYTVLGASYLVTVPFLGLSANLSPYQLLPALPGARDCASQQGQKLLGLAEMGAERLCVQGAPVLPLPSAFPEVSLHYLESVAEQLVAAEPRTAPGAGSAHWKKSPLGLAQKGCK